jgi:hypothetical protein
MSIGSSGPTIASGPIATHPIASSRRSSAVAFVFRVAPDCRHYIIPRDDRHYIIPRDDRSYRA